MTHTTIAKIEVVPVAGHDSMLLNLSGAHAPFFTRNIAILTDSEGREGVGEVPGGEPIRRTIEEAAELLVGQPVTRYRSLLRQVAERFGPPEVILDDNPVMVLPRRHTGAARTA